MSSPIEQPQREWVWVDELVCLSDITSRTDIKVTTLHHYRVGRHRHSRPFPKPVLETAMGPLFKWPEVKEWLEEWIAARKPGNHKKSPEQRRAEAEAKEQERHAVRLRKLAEREAAAKAAGEAAEKAEQVCNWSAGCSRPKGTIKPNQVFCNPHQLIWDGPSTRPVRKGGPRKKS